MKNSSEQNAESFVESSSYTAYELYNRQQKEIPKLLDPFFQKVGVAALVGSSDTGKSTLLRQMALCICLKQKEFLGFPLNSTHHRVLYLSTEDDYTTVSYAIRKQVNHLKAENPDELDLELLKNLEFLFYTDDIFHDINKRLKKEQYDLIVIDAFADVFQQEINANTQVRQFLNGFDNLAKRYGCLVVFLHHIGKRTDEKNPSKHSIIGSQAFEAKMRSALELRINRNNENWRDLWVLKANFLKKSYKDQSYVLNFQELYFKNLNKRGTGKVSKHRNPEIIEKVMELDEQGLSYRKIEEKLKGTSFAIGKSTIGQIIKENKNRD